MQESNTRILLYGYGKTKSSTRHLRLFQTNIEFRLRIIRINSLKNKSALFRHTCIYDGKLLGCALLDIKSLGDERTHLTHYGTAQLEV